MILKCWNPNISQYKINDSIGNNKKSYNETKKKICNESNWDRLVSVKSLSIRVTIFVAIIVDLRKQAIFNNEFEKKKKSNRFEDSFGNQVTMDRFEPIALSIARNLKQIYLQICVYCNCNRSGFIAQVYWLLIQKNRLIFHTGNDLIIARIQQFLRHLLELNVKQHRNAPWNWEQRI